MTDFGFEDLPTDEELCEALVWHGLNAEYAQTKTPVPACEARVSTCVLAVQASYTKAPPLKCSKYCP